MLVQLFDPDDEVGDGVEKPVEEEGGSDEEGVALALHDGFPVAKVFGGGAGLGITAGTGKGRKGQPRGTASAGSESSRPDPFGERPDQGSLAESPLSPPRPQRTLAQPTLEPLDLRFRCECFFFSFLPTQGLLPSSVLTRKSSLL
ncbi:hypothetical protein CR513_51054, partial [Mucuna pruriens]